MDYNGTSYEVKVVALSHEQERQFRVTAEKCEAIKAALESAPDGRFIEFADGKAVER